MGFGAKVPQDVNKTIARRTAHHLNCHMSGSIRAIYKLDLTVHNHGLQFVRGSSTITNGWLRSTQARWVCETIQSRTSDCPGCARYLTPIIQIEKGYLTPQSAGESTDSQ